VTDRTRSEDSELEVVEEVLHVATALRDMGRGKHVRNSSGAGSADGSSHQAVRLTSTRTNATTAGKLETPCALRDRCKRWETGVDVRWGAGKLTNKRVQSAYGQAVWKREIGSRLKKNPRGPECSRASYAVLYICNWRCRVSGLGRQTMWG
jgi:hypothetical protein